MFEDEVLKWKFKRGSDDALTLIYEKYLEPMLTLAMGLLNDTAAAEDIVQDVFVSFARARPSFRPGGSLSGYLATSVVNRVRDHRRQLRRRPREDVNRRPSTEPRGPEQAVILSEQTELLVKVMVCLPEEQREVVLLRLKADMKFREIARLQQTSVGTALSRYRYGLQRLRSMLNGEVEP
jgi:RNA polymerase sigma-70 factor (ECF subfamily)